MVVLRTAKGLREEDDRAMQDDDTERLAAGALASAVAQLRVIATSATTDALEQCDIVVEQLDAQSINRRHRTSLLKALSLAVQNRMPAGRAKAHVMSRLTGLLAGIENEGRFDASSRLRAGFSAAGV